MTHACHADGCIWPAAVWVVRVAPMSATRPGFVIVRPLRSPDAVGTPLCIDCAHVALDLTVAAAQERRGATP